MIRFPPQHEHIVDPALGESTHCICHKLDPVPAGGCGRRHCVNRVRSQDTRRAREETEDGIDDPERCHECKPARARASRLLWLLSLLLRGRR